MHSHAAVEAWQADEVKRKAEKLNRTPSSAVQAVHCTSPEGVNTNSECSHPFRLPSLAFDPHHTPLNTKASTQEP